jgi:periplasmic divalent cation tolerance protein
MYTIVFITAENKKEANRIAEALIKERLAACVNIIAGIESVFRWEGKIDRAKEFLLLVKTRKSLVNKIISRVKQLHSYEVPEIIALGVIAGNKNYLEWVSDSTR